MNAVTTVLIGCGGRGVRAHGAWTKSSPKFELLAVCDLDAARREAAGAQLGVPAEADYRRLLARDDVQSVIIATNTRAHAPIALDAIRAGKHVLIEKPLAESAAVCRRLAEAAAAAGVIGMVGYQFRFSEFGAALKREAAAINPIQALLTVQRGPMGAQYFFPDHYGGVVDTATHTVHLALWVMGGQPTGVYGTVRRGTILGDQTIEFMNVMVDFEEGARTATVISSMFGIQTENLISLIGTRGCLSSPDRRRLRIVRHQGVAQPGPNIRPPGLEVQEVDTGGGPDRSTGAMLDHFADLISGAAREQRGTTLEEGMYAVAVTEAMTRAAETGRRIPLREVLG